MSKFNRRTTSLLSQRHNLPPHCIASRCDGDEVHIIVSHSETLTVIRCSVTGAKDVGVQLITLAEYIERRSTAPFDVEGSRAPLRFSPSLLYQCDTASRPRSRRGQRGGRAHLELSGTNASRRSGLTPPIGAPGGVLEFDGEPESPAPRRLTDATAVAWNRDLKYLGGALAYIRALDSEHGAA
jgi:hypothetical protein